MAVLDVYDLIVKTYLTESDDEGIWPQMLIVELIDMKKKKELVILQ